MVKTSRLPSRKQRYKFDQGKHLVEIKLKDEKQLFDYRDPAPFRERDLDEDAANYIVSSVKEFTLNTPLKLIIHLGASAEARQLDNASIIEAIRLHFEYERELTHKNIRFRLRQGQLALVTGIVVLTICLFISDFLSQNFMSSFFGRTLATGFNISGWVAMWYPSHLFIYEWWPQEYNKRVFRKIAEMEMEVREQRS